MQLYLIGEWCNWQVSNIINNSTSLFSSSRFTLKYCTSHYTSYKCHLTLFAKSFKGFMTILTRSRCPESITAEQRLGHSILSVSRGDFTPALTLMESSVNWAFSEVAFRILQSLATPSHCQLYLFSGWLHMQWEMCGKIQPYNINLTKLDSGEAEPQ